MKSRRLRAKQIFDALQSSPVRRTMCGQGRTGQGIIAEHVRLREAKQRRRFHGNLRSDTSGRYAGVTGNSKNARIFAAYAAFIAHIFLMG